MTDTSPERMAEIQRICDETRAPGPCMGMVRDLSAKVAELEMLHDNAIVDLGIQNDRLETSGDTYVALQQRIAELEAEGLLRRAVADTERDRKPWMVMTDGFALAGLIAIASWCVVTVLLLLGVLP